MRVEPQEWDEFPYKVPGSSLILQNEVTEQSELGKGLSPDTSLPAP